MAPVHCSQGDPPDNVLQYYTPKECYVLLLIYTLQSLTLKISNLRCLCNFHLAFLKPFYLYTSIQN